MRDRALNPLDVEFAGEVEGGFSGLRRRKEWDQTALTSMVDLYLDSRSLNSSAFREKNLR